MTAAHELSLEELDALSQAAVRAPLELPVLFHAIETLEVYETRENFYIVGMNRLQTRFHLCRIYRMTQELEVHEDAQIYSKSGIHERLQAIGEETQESGGLKCCLTACGIVGFVRFVMGYNIILIKRARKVGALGGHVVYTIEETAMLPVSHPSMFERADDEGAGALRNFFRSTEQDKYLKRVRSDESRYKSIFTSMEMTKNFYFSYTYDVTRTLQYNMVNAGKTRARVRKGLGNRPKSMFVWNHFLISHLYGQPVATKQPASDPSASAPADQSSAHMHKLSHHWLLPIIHGSFEQVKCSVFGRLLTITLIARRSRLFAGTRYRKRGMNDRGNTANDVEAEQIVATETRFTSYVQCRASIPLFWTQESHAMVAKPAIVVQKTEPMCETTRLHFQELMARYGSPVVAVNLVRQRESRPRETIIGSRFTSSVALINRFLPKEHRIDYLAWDFKKVSKSKSASVVDKLALISEWAVQRTGVFASHPSAHAIQVTPKSTAHVHPKGLYTDGEVHLLGQATQLSDMGFRTDRDLGMRQMGVMRVNCIDSLDRTNVAQFCVGKRALNYQLFSLGVTSSPRVQATAASGVLNVLLDMYERMGDCLALQYGGSQMHRQMKKDAGTITSAPALLRAKKRTNKGKEVFVSLMRHYQNSFQDHEKQDSMNLFLGRFQPVRPKRTVADADAASGDDASSRPPVNIWDLGSDYYLHNRTIAQLPDLADSERKGTGALGICHYDNNSWWQRPILHFARANGVPLRLILPEYELTGRARAIEAARLYAICRLHEEMSVSAYHFFKRKEQRRLEIAGAPQPDKASVELVEENDDDQVPEQDEEAIADLLDSQDLAYEHLYQPGEISFFDDLLADEELEKRVFIRVNVPVKHAGFARATAATEGSPMHALATPRTRQYRLNLTKATRDSHFTTGSGASSRRLLFESAMPGADGAVSDGDGGRDAGGAMSPVHDGLFGYQHEDDSASDEDDLDGPTDLVDDNDARGQSQYRRRSHDLTDGDFFPTKSRRNSDASEDSDLDSDDELRPRLPTGAPALPASGTIPESGPGHQDSQSTLRPDSTYLSIRSWLSTDRLMPALASSSNLAVASPAPDGVPPPNHIRSLSASSVTSATSTVSAFGLTRPIDSEPHLGKGKAGRGRHRRHRRGRDAMGMWTPSFVTNRKSHLVQCLMTPAWHAHDTAAKAISEVPDHADAAADEPDQLITTINVVDIAAHNAVSAAVALSRYPAPRRVGVRVARWPGTVQPRALYTFDRLSAEEAARTDSTATPGHRGSLLIATAPGKDPQHAQNSSPRGSLDALSKLTLERQHHLAFDRSPALPVLIPAPAHTFRVYVATGSSDSLRSLVVGQPRRPKLPPPPPPGGAAAPAPTPAPAAPERKSRAANLGGKAARVVARLIAGGSKSEPATREPTQLEPPPPPPSATDASKTRKSISEYFEYIKLPKLLGTQAATSLSAFDASNPSLNVVVSSARPVAHEEMFVPSPAQNAALDPASELAKAALGPEFVSKMMDDDAESKERFQDYLVMEDDYHREKREQTASSRLLVMPKVQRRYRRFAFVELPVSVRLHSENEAFYRSYVHRSAAARRA